MKKLIYIFLLVFLFSCERNISEPDNSDDPLLEEISYVDFFNEPELLKLHEIELFVTQSEWDRLLVILQNNIKSDQYVKADYIYRHTPGSLTNVDTVKEVGFRIRGNTTRRLPYKNGEYRRAHFKVKFDKRFDQIEGTPEYEIRKKRTFADIEALNLKWGREGNEADVSQIREIYQYEMMRQAGVYVPKTTSTRLIINVGDDRIDYGIYTAIEPIDDTFLEHYLGDDAGDLYKCLWKGMGPATLSRTSASGTKTGVGDAEIAYEPSYDLKEGDLENNTLIDFVYKLGDLSGNALKSYLDANFDVDNYLRFLAMNVILGMPDDYWAMGNNYYLFFPDDGKITFIPYDYDHGLGGGWTPFDAANAKIYEWRDGTGNDYRALMKVLDYSEYRALYESYLAEFALSSNAIFDYSDYKNNYFDELKSMYSPYLENDIGEGEAFEHYGEEQYFSSKKSSLESQLN